MKELNEMTGQELLDALETENAAADELERYCSEFIDNRRARGWTAAELAEYAEERENLRQTELGIAAVRTEMNLREARAEPKKWICWMGRGSEC